MRDRFRDHLRGVPACLFGVLGLLAGALVVGCGGRASSGAADKAVSSSPQTLSELPEGTYTGTLTRQIGSAATYLAQVKVNVTIDSQAGHDGSAGVENVVGVIGPYTPNLANAVYPGMISGAADFTPTWQNTLIQPYLTIDMGDGSGPQKHEWVFEEPVEQGGHIFVTAHIDEDTLTNPDPNGPAISEFITFTK